MNDPRRVVITGLGLATPIGIGVEAVWEAALNATSGIGPIQAFDASGLGCSVGGEVPPFKMTDFVPKSYRKSTKVMARDIMIAVVAAYHAVKDAGLKTKCLIDRGEVEAPPNLDATRFGANIGAGSICADLRELAGALATAVDDDRNFSLAQWGSEGMGNLTPLWLLKFLPNMLACHVTIVHDAQAPSNTITCGEASSHLAIGEGFRTVARGDADICICGGAESKTNPMGAIRPYLLDRLVPDGRFEPARTCRPFSTDQPGAVPAEGGGLIILEDAQHAQARGARIYAEVAGFGASANTHDWRTPDPQGTGIGMAVQKALDDAAVTPDDIDLISTFGSGIADYDASEVAALKNIFGGRLAQIPALAGKGAVGINGAGNGAIDIALAAKAVQHNTVPPSVNTDRLDPACPLKIDPAEPYDASLGYVVSLAYALCGGQNAALVLKRYEE